jgi:hypothetical protein
MKKYLSILLLIFFIIYGKDMTGQGNNVKMHSDIINASFETLYKQFGKNEAIIIIREHFLIEVNLERSKLKNSPLRYNDILNLTSQEHADDMAKRSCFSHVNPDSLSAADRLDAHNYDYSMAAENISYNDKNIKDVIEGFLISKSGHRDIFTVSDYEEVGFGIGLELIKSSNENHYIFYTATVYGVRFQRVNQ